MKVPLPSPKATATFWELKLTGMDAMSGLPSPLKSATERDPPPEGELVGPEKPAWPLPRNIEPEEVAMSGHASPFRSATAIELEDPTPPKFAAVKLPLPFPN